MNIGDVFSFSFGAIRLRKLRAGLTTLGVVIGIAAIVALLSISQGLQDTITAQLQTGFATDTLIVTTGGGFGLGSSDSGFSLLVSDTQTINNIENVSASVAIVQRVCFIRSGEREALLSVVGVNFKEYAQIYSSTFVAESGEISEDPGYETIVVGKRISDPWDNGTIIVNVHDSVELLWINATARPPRNETYVGRVDAVLKEIGGLNVGGPSDARVYVPISQAQRFFGTDTCDTIVVKLTNDKEQTIEGVTEAIKSAFSGQVTVTSSTAVLSIISNVTSTIEVFLVGIAAISLVVAGVGIMNIMLVSLMERTREIGLLKALGMKNRIVLSIFLCEAMIIGLVGAGFGVSLGWILANVVARVFSGGGVIPRNQAVAAGGFSITPTLTLPVFFGAFAFGLVVGVVFALYPAWRASRLRPVDALRYE